ncbi:hypothetical protein B0T22DRAFT_456332 [Podospora appendiculata]|uniref:RRM domain-containing protein n=1 Tax=Podospora appendiculata TaxID=314037 RepID=A0AAE0XM65_9PEZI|nr:hypothetical protein B0T22DRAFT_456332 [Podospora appendiculata]
MNQIRAIQALNKREIENGVPPSASWHVDYRDTAYVYFGGLPFDLTEGDVITIFSQFGEPVFLKLARDKETGKSKGYGWLKYEDQRSTDLAVDNLGGAEIAGRLVRVDHARYKHRDDEDPEEGRIGWEDMLRREGGAQGESEDGMDVDEEDAEKKQRPLFKEEVELQRLIQDHDDDDPMKQFLIDEKKKEVDEAIKREKKRAEGHSHSHGHRHRDKDRHHRSSHRSRRDGDDDHHKRDRIRDKDDRDSGRNSKPRALDVAPVEKRRREDRDDDDDRRERRRRDSRDRESRGYHDRPRKRIEDRRRADGADEDKGREDHTRHRRRGSEDMGHRDERSRLRNRDRRRSRSRSPAARKD